VNNYVGIHVIVTLPVATDKTAAFIEKNSKIFGRKSDKITDNQKRMNEASKELYLALISNRGLLIEQARQCFRIHLQKRMVLCCM